MSDLTTDEVVTRKPRELSDKFIRVPLAEILIPKSGRICYGPSWWHVTSNDEVLFFRKKWHSPQCNSNKSVVDHLPIEGCAPRFVEMAFLPHDCRDYC